MSGRPPRTHNKHGRKLERYYQVIVEKLCGGSHERLKCGITDITTKDLHVEIKEWKQWKTALGQLEAYNVMKWKPKRYVVLFGKPPRKNLTTICEIFQSKGIGVYQFEEDAEDTLRVLYEAKDNMEIDEEVDAA
jgi:hypothetical protein